MIPFDAAPAEIERLRLARVKLVEDAEARELREFGNIGGRYYPPDWRNIVTLDFSGCRHSTCSLIEVDAFTYDANHQPVRVGKWGLEICQRCGVLVQKECAHEFMDWLFDGKLLVCRNCGVDGT